jgi:spermidine synthase
MTFLGPQETFQIKEARLDPRLLILLTILFLGSGCAALIYEIVWYQLLEFVIGATGVSLGVLLATFMGGLCIGSIAFPRIAALHGYHPLRVLAAIELGIGMCGLLVWWGMPLVDRLYLAVVGHGLPAILLRALVASLCLLPPTILMGASLPAASRWIPSSRRGISWIGLLYGANTVGAVFGCVLAGFYLLRLFDMATATYTAASINAAVGLAAFALARRAPARGEATELAVPAQRTPTTTPAAGMWTVHATIALSGATALGAETVWMRLLGLTMGATVYTFSIILAVFLVGLGIGSGAGARLSRTVPPRNALGYSQLLIAAAITWTAFMLANSLPYWPAPAGSSPWEIFRTDLVRASLAMLPAALLWGASFPLALAAAAEGGAEPGQLVGSVYAANTGGAIAGALLFSLFLIPQVGTVNSQRILILLAADSALLIFLTKVWTRRVGHGVLCLAAILGIGTTLAMSLPSLPPDLLAYGRRFLTTKDHVQVLYTAEGLNSTIAVTDWDDTIQFHVSGKVEASTGVYDMRLQRTLGHLPALLHPNPRSVLIVGFGAGVTSGSFTLHPSVQRIVICEIEPLIPPLATYYFGQQNYGVMHDPRTQMVYDDARHFVLTTPETFDIITSDPIHPWVKGSATLYTREYFQMVKDHLNPGGLVTQWVPLYETDLDTVKSEFATFFEVFPNGSIWANEDWDEGGYDVFLLGAKDPLTIDVDALQQRMEAPGHAAVARSLSAVTIRTATDFLSIYTTQASDLKPWLDGAIINRDRNLRLQFLAGMAMNRYDQGMIYNEMLAYRRFPENLMVGSEAALKPLRDSIQPYHDQSSGAALAPAPEISIGSIENPDG